MTLPKGVVRAVYRSTGIGRYRGNPLIEALPPILDLRRLREGLSEKIVFRQEDALLDGQTRVHVISQLLDGFFQPLARHIDLEQKLSITLRQGYVGRNPATGDLNAHIQNGYERVMKGDLQVFRFDHVESTAKSLSLIGCSGSGKTSSLNRILATYPQVIYHDDRNFTQLVFLKIDCPHDGSLKSLCHNFFREMDTVLGTNYVRRYVEKRHGVETLIAAMAHIANTHAVGLLVIDEIQHLSVKNSGGAEKMLNFFVTLVNQISVPVVMVGTPKARSVFEMDLRSARRSAGLGSILWEPLARPASNEDVSKTEWGAFTNLLWKYQWLTKAPPEISDEVREVWYDLSQGIMDVVIKLFVLSQTRAIVTGIERITPALMRKVYEDEFKPIHPMIEALRSGDATKIARYSDLTIPDVDKRILELGNLLRRKDPDVSVVIPYQGNSQAIRLHNMLTEMGYESDLLKPLIARMFEENPNLTMKDLIPLIVNRYLASEREKAASSSTNVKVSRPAIKQKDWHTLDSHDLRFLFSQTADEVGFHQALAGDGRLFDADRWVASFGESPC